MKTLTIGLFAVVAAFAAPIPFAVPPLNVQFVDPGAGVSNGSVYVGPYNLTVDGSPVQGICISPFLEVAPPYDWQAHWEAIGDFANPQQTALIEAAWLADQFAGNPTGEWAGIHQAIWDLMGASYTDADTKAWVVAANANYGHVDASGWEVLVPDPGDLTQSFLVTTPEPGNGLLIGAALAAIGGVLRKRVV